MILGIIIKKPPQAVTDKDRTVIMLPDAPEHHGKNIFLIFQGPAGVGLYCVIYHQRGLQQVIVQLVKITEDSAVSDLQGIIILKNAQTPLNLRQRQGRTGQI